MEKKENESTKRLDHQPLQKVSGNKVKQDLKIKNGIETEMAKKIVKMIKDAKLKVQASIQGDEVRVQGAKRDDLQECIALIKKPHERGGAHPVGRCGHAVVKGGNASACNVVFFCIGCSARNTNERINHDGREQENGANQVP